MSNINKLQAKAATERAAWARIDVDPGDLFKHPTITPILINALGSISKVLDYLMMSDSLEAKAVLKKYNDASPSDRKIIPFEGWCLAAKSTPKKIMGIIMQAVVDQSDIATELLLATSKKEIVQKTIKLAKTTKGHEERKIVLQNRGVMAAPKNQVFNNFGSVTQDNRKQLANISVSQLGEDDDKISEGVDLFNTNRAARKELPEKVEIIDIMAEE